MRIVFVILTITSMTVFCGKQKQQKKKKTPYSCDTIDLALETEVRENISTLTPPVNYIVKVKNTGENLYGYPGFNELLLKDSFRRYMHLAVDQAELLICYECHTSYNDHFKTIADFVEHFRTEHDGSYNNWICPACGFKARNAIHHVTVTDHKVTGFKGKLHQMRNKIKLCFEDSRLIPQSRKKIQD